MPNSTSGSEAILTTAIPGVPAGHRWFPTAAGPILTMRARRRSRTEASTAERKRLLRVLEIEQPALLVEPSAIARELAAAADHAMARDHDGNGIRAVGQ